MKRKLIYVLIFLYALFDAKTVARGAADGLELVTAVVIPSLFPYIFLGMLCSQAIQGSSSFLLKPLEKICGIPEGCGNLFLIGILGGYPVGAQVVTDAYKQGFITKSTAERLLGFCNNAGPGFIFGMIGGILQNALLCWILWIGQILSAIIVGAILPGKGRQICRMKVQRPTSISETLEKTVLVCAKVAGWIILFRTLIAILEKWILGGSANIWKVCVAGILELSNGCIYVNGIDSSLSALLILGSLLSFGGICVHLQTKSVCKCLLLKQYLIAKILQAIIVIPIICILWKITVAFFGDM